jgi:imidazolonepropionase-like amidohydrolase
MRTTICLLACAFAAGADELVFTRVTVIDVRAGRALPDRSVVVSGDRIIEVGAPGAVSTSRRARFVDGRGKYLIPGLWDMHVHMFSRLPPDASDPAAEGYFLPHFVVNGVTGVRSMFDNLEAVRRLREMIASGQLAGPRIVASGPILDGARPFVIGSIACTNAEDGREAVRRVARAGADFVKVYSWLGREAYFAIAAESARLGLPFAGHLPNSVSAAEAARAGQKSMEHLMGVMRPGASAAEREALFAVFKELRVWQTPTLVALRSVALFGEPALAADPRLAAVPPRILEFWKTGGPGMTTWDPEGRKRRFEGELALVAEMHRAGVKILAGSDTPNPYVFPGSGLHDELELLVRAGFTPLEALRSSTMRAAEYLGEPDRAGNVAPGMRADLVLIGGDPLESITNCRRIEAVVLGGRLLLKSDLDSILRQAQVRAHTLR